MNLTDRRDPVILLGIHRSGTSLLGELLSDIGVFMGRKRNAHHEAWHFLNNNKKLLQIAHADWDLPLVFEFLLKSKQTTSAVIDFLKSETTERKMIREFFGRQLAFREKFSPSSSMWGWKDPRTSITFPLWYNIYPEAKFIWVTRNGVDVASSMKVREDQKLHRIFSRATSARCQSMDEAFKVWEEYNEFFYTYMDIIPADRLHTVRYEDILTDSTENLGRIAEFLELSNPVDLIETATERIDPEKVNRYSSDPELSEFYSKVRNTRWMKEFNY